MRSLGDIKPGQSIGRYEFLIPIAEGGMASVWAARMKGTRGFQKTLAVKMMLSSLSDNPQFQEMFLDEARIASQIHHPNVVEIFDLGEEADVLYLVMEYVDGEPVSTIFRTAQKKGGIPLPIAIRIVSDACAGLHAAHELCNDSGELVGLVHRDVSPQNILVSYDGTIKIVDFGVAKAEGRESEKTMAGTVKGKAPYMSPEQALGKDIDRRTDVFALGIVLFHLTTGKHPFRAENDILTLHNIIEKPAPKPSTIVPNYPVTLERVVMKALEKDPANRYQTSAELEAALDRVLPPSAPRIRPADVGRFVRETVGERGEKRREALRAAVRLADERLQHEVDAAKLSARPISEIGLTGQLGVPLPGLRTGQFPVQPDGTIPPFTGRLPPLPTPPPGGRSGLYAAIPEAAPSSVTSITGSAPSITGVAAAPLAATNPPPPDTLPSPQTGKSKAGLMVGAVLGAVVLVGLVVGLNTRKGTQPMGQPLSTGNPVAAAAPAQSSTADSNTPTSAPAPTTTANADDSAPSLDPSQLPTAAGDMRGFGPGGKKGAGGAAASSSSAPASAPVAAADTAKPADKPADPPKVADAPKPVDKPAEKPAEKPADKPAGKKPSGGGFVPTIVDPGF